MHQPILLKILSKLPPTEFSGFRKIFKKRFPNSKISLQLLEQLGKFYPEFQLSNTDKETIFHKAIHKDYDPKRWSKELKILEEHLKEYLILNFLETQKLEKDLLLLQVYKKYKVEDMFFQHLSETKQLVEQLPTDLWLWQHRLYLEHEHYFSLLSENTVASDASVENAMSHLDTFYAVAKLKYACELLNRHHSLQKPFPPIHLLEEIHKTPHIDSNIYYALYRQIYLLLQHRNLESYFSTKTFVFENLSQVSKADQHTLFVYLLNTLSDSFKQQREKFPAELFHLYQFAIGQEVFILDGYFDKEIFNNIIDLACKLKKFDWVDNFMTTWQDTLEDSIREDTILISKAFIYFEKGQYSQTTDFLNDLKFVNIYYKIRAKILEISCFYEMGELDLVYSKCEAFEKLIQRDKIINAANKQKILNFTHIVKQLATKVDPNKKQLLEKFTLHKNMYFGTWLYTKIQQLD